MVERLKRREPGIAPAVVKENLAAMTEKAGQIAPVRGVGQALHPVHIDRFLDLVDIDALAVLRPERLRAAVVKMPGILTFSAAMPLSHGNDG
jgi:hypothetical protein